MKRLVLPRKKVRNPTIDQQKILLEREQQQQADLEAKLEALRKQIGELKKD